MTSAELEALAIGVARADKRSVAGALSLVEDTRPAKATEVVNLLNALSPRPGVHRIGVTGPPGVGKSTLAAAMTRLLRQHGHSVGVVAVDPSSSRSGGALLGDRLRIAVDRSDEGLFIRSLATGGEAGGLSYAVDAVACVFGAAYDRVLIETTGVGQTESDIVHLADTVVLVIQPGSGDVLQFLKAGIIEVPDIVVVNKSDLGHVARVAARDLRAALGHSAVGHSVAGSATSGPVTPVESTCAWTIPVLSVSAQDGEGIEALADAIGRHRHTCSPMLEARRRRGAVAWTLALITRRYGTFGIELLGGEKAARASAGKLLDEGQSATEAAWRLGERIVASHRGA